LRKGSLKDFARKGFSENLENVILQSSLARSTLLLHKGVEHNIKRGFVWKMIYRE